MGAPAGEAGGAAGQALRFAEHCAAALGALAGVALEPADRPPGPGSLGVRFSIAGERAGTLTLRFEDPLLRRLVIALCERVGAPFGLDDFEDALCELGNFIVSDIVNRLSAEGVEADVSIPGVVISEALPARAPCAAAHLASREGVMSLEWVPRSGEGGC